MAGRAHEVAVAAGEQQPVERKFEKEEAEGVGGSPEEREGQEKAWWAALGAGKRATGE